MDKITEMEKELLADMEENPVEYRETVNNVFEIDSNLRTINIPVTVKNIGVESDDDVKRLEFTMPKQYGEFDLSQFRIRINYMNANGDKSIYLVEDKKVSGDSITFSWLIGRDVAKYKGQVNFIVCLKLSDEKGKVLKELNTTLCRLDVLEGLEVVPVIDQKTTDLIEQLLKMVETETTGAVQKVSEEGVKQIAEVQKAAQEIIADRERIQITGSQVKELSEKATNDLTNGKFVLSYAKTEVGTTKDGINVDTTIDGVISEFISVIPTEKIYVHTRGDGNSVVSGYHGVYYYDINKTVMGCETPEFDKFVQIIIPEDCYYIRTQRLYVHKELKYAKEKQNVKAFRDIYNRLDELLKYSFEYETEEYMLDENVKMLNGTYLNKTGEELKANDWNCTDFIDVWNVPNIYITNQLPLYGNPSILFYDNFKRVVHFTEDKNTKLNIALDEIREINPDIEFIRVSSIGDVKIERRVLASSSKTFKEILKEIETIKEDLSKYKYETNLQTFRDITSQLDITNGYIDDIGKFIEIESCRTTGYINIDSYEEIYVTGNLQQAGASAWAIYDSSKNFIAKREAILGNVKLYKIDFNAILLENPNAKYIRISSYYTNKLSVGTFITPNMSDLYDVFARQNVLFGKKYVSCGDSFTAGQFGEEYPKEEYYDEAFQSWKTYPWYIAKRNNMFLVNESISGSTMYNNGTQEAFSVTRYKKIPQDADYITLMFGLNETSAPIGTIDDTDNTTVMGAWNVTLEYLIETHPFAKIGIIISDAWLSKDLYNALIDISKSWGIPYLDLKNDEKVPLCIGGRLDIPVKQKAKDLRNNAFQMSETDSHPNPKTHEYRSTIVENFLRSL